MSSDLKVCTYNIGASASDYMSLLRYRNPEFKINSSEEQEQVLKNYDADQEVSAKTLFEERVDVYCLQEVVEKTRPLIKGLVERNFELFNAKCKYPDCVIALNMDRFEDVENHSTIIDQSDVAIVLATEKQTGKRIAFVSAHVPGLDLDTPIIDEQSASFGDIQCKKIAKVLSEIRGDIQIVGADMNANPEKWNPRFEKFSRKNFETIRTNQPTNVNPRSEDYKEREIDFFFGRKLKEDLFSRISSLFNSMLKISFCVEKTQPLMPNNGSDHVPVIAKLSIQNTPSLVSRMWTAFKSLFVNDASQVADTNCRSDETRLLA